MQQEGQIVDSDSDDIPDLVPDDESQPNVRSIPTPLLTAFESYRRFVENYHSTNSLSAENNHIGSLSAEDDQESLLAQINHVDHLLLENSPTGPLSLENSPTGPLSLENSPTGPLSSEGLARPRLVRQNAMYFVSAADMQQRGNMCFVPIRRTDDDSEEK